MALEDKIPRTNISVLLEDKGMFSRGEPWIPEKFVQLVVGGEPYLRFCEEGVSTHRKILLEFIDVCRETGDPVISEEDYQMYIQHAEKTREVAFFPVELGRYQAVGMGAAYVDKTKHTIQLEGKSQDYGLRPNREHLNQISAYLQDWKLEIKE